MNLVALLLSIMVILTFINGVLFFKKLVKLQKENNELLQKLLDKDKVKSESKAMPSEELEKLKAEFMKSKK
jgi:hypothetical protein|tara:strand:+ start:4084 stop:4296 length:213 start_codon:yes stop_codon:yes gene_type:complete